MNAQTKPTPAKPDPRHMAKSIVRQYQMGFCGELLLALVDEIDCELSNGWVDEDGNCAEGSLEAAAASTAAETFRDYLKTLRHSGDEQMSWADWSGVSSYPGGC